MPILSGKREINMPRTKKTAETAEKETKVTKVAEKAVAEKVEEKKAAKKVAPKKEAPKKEAPKKEAPKKEAPKKPAEAKVNFFVEYGNVQVAIDEVVANVKATYGKDAKEISVCPQPAQSQCYFVAR